MTQQQTQIERLTTLLQARNSWMLAPEDFPKDKFKSVLPYSNYSLDELEAMVFSPGYQLWTHNNQDFAVTRETVDKTLEIIAVVGEKGREWPVFIDIAEEYARFKNLKAVELVGRPCWKKLLGDYENVYRKWL